MKVLDSKTPLALVAGTLRTLGKLGALGALALPALAQTTPGAPGAAQATQATQGAPAGQGGNTVVVTGTRGAAPTPDTVIAAKSKVLSRKYASSCAFMSTPNAAEDDVALAYMRDFGMEDSISNEAERFSDFAPDGNAARATDSSSLDEQRKADNATGVPDTMAPAVKCGATDRRFAAGRNAILRKDKSLAQGFEALDQRDYPRAMSLLETAYRKIGYDEAAVALAKMHLYGMGTPKSTQQAVRWLREVTDSRFDPQSDRLKFDPREPQAMSDKVEAAFMLARIHERGIGVPANPAEAKKWYARAADFGFIPAENILGQAWLAGYGGQQDTGKALAHLKEAAQAGFVTAQYNLGKLYYNGDTGLARDLKQAGAWFDAAARAGHAGALFAAGRMYDLGEGVPADQKRAIVYYKEAAVKGNGDAEFALATFFYNGEVVAKDPGTARRLFDAAARQGQVDAMFNLGVMLANGEDGAKDATMAYVWFSLARAGGHASADAALKAVAPQLSAQDLARADAILKPRASS